MQYVINCTAVIPAEDGLKEKLEAAFATQNSGI